MSESTTPRTDEARKTYFWNDVQHEFVTYDFARQFETELRDAQKASLSEGRLRLELETELAAVKAREDKLRGALESQQSYLEIEKCACTVGNEAGDRDICGRCIALDEADKALEAWRDAK